MALNGDYYSTDLTCEIGRSYVTLEDKTLNQNDNFANILHYTDLAITKIKMNSSKIKFGKPKSYLELVWFARIAKEKISQKLESKNLTKSKKNELNMYLISLDNKILSIYKDLESKITQREKNTLYEIHETIDGFREDLFGFDYPQYGSFDALTEQF